MEVFFKTSQLTRVDIRVSHSLELPVPVHSISSQKHLFNNMVGNIVRFQNVHIQVQNSLVDTLNVLKLPAYTAEHQNCRRCIVVGERRAAPGNARMVT